MPIDPTQPHDHVRLDVGYAYVCEICRKPLRPGLPANAGGEYMPLDHLTGFVDEGELNARRDRAARYAQLFGKRVGGHKAKRG